MKGLLRFVMWPRNEFTLSEQRKGPTIKKKKKKEKRGYAEDSLDRDLLRLCSCPLLGSMIYRVPGTAGDYGENSGRGKLEKRSNNQNQSIN